jgi:hypothetical protein
MSASARPRPGVVDICDPRAQTARRSLTRTRILGSECLSSLQFTELRFSIPAKRNPDTSFGIPSLTESPRAASRSSGVARSGCGDDCCDRHSELTAIRKPGQHAPLQTKRGTPRLFLRRVGQPRHSGRQAIGRAPAAPVVKAFPRRTVKCVCRITIAENGRRPVRFGLEIHQAKLSFRRCPSGPAGREAVRSTRE